MYRLHESLNHLKIGLIDFPYITKLCLAFVSVILTLY